LPELLDNLLSDCSLTRRTDPDASGGIKPEIHIMRMVYRIYLTLVLVALAATASCLGVPHNNQDSATEAVVAFHGKLDQQLYQSIVVGSDKEFRARSDAESYLKKVREFAGKVTKSVKVTSSVQNMGDEAQVTLAYMTQFEQAQGTESFVFRVKDRRAKLMFYEVRFGVGFGGLD